MIPKILVHYGHSTFDMSKFRTPMTSATISLTKPSGGFWASPAKSTIGWIDLLREHAANKLIDYEEYAEIAKDYFFFELLVPKDRCFIINTEKDLNSLPTIDLVGRLFGAKCLDYVAINKEYDAIYLTKEGLELTRESKPLNTQGWDCESVLILNPYCISYESRKPSLSIASS